MLSEAVQYLNDGMSIVIADATHSTIESRLKAFNLAKKHNLNSLLMECFCPDQEGLLKRIEGKASLPEFQGIQKEEAFQNFLKRHKKYLEQRVNPTQNEIKYAQVPLLRYDIISSAISVTGKISKQDKEMIHMILYALQPKNVLHY